MNTDYLRYFSTLAELQHYGNAAKELNISQPGLSMQFILWKKTMDFHFLRKPVEMYDLALMD